MKGQPEWLKTHAAIGGTLETLDRKPRRVNPDPGGQSGQDESLLRESSRPPRALATAELRLCAAAGN